MPKSRPSLSVNVRQLERHGVHSVANADVARDSPMSPESEDSFSVAAADSPRSQDSFGINAEPLPEDQGDVVMDVPPSPEDQDDFGVDADMSSEGGSPSPQSQCSFGINSMPLPEPNDTHFLPAVRIPGVQDEGTEHPPSQPGVTLGVGAAPLPVAHESNLSAPPVHTEDLMNDFTQPTEHGRHFGNASAAPGDLRVDLALPTGADGVNDNRPAAHSKPHFHCLQNTPNSADVAWKWGEYAPPHSDTETTQEGQEDAISQDHPEVQHETVNPVRCITRQPI
jgi:hypothetical protein